MKIAIVGSRDWAVPDMVSRLVLRAKERYGNLWIVSGGAQGVDTFAETAAKRYCVPYLIFPADWKAYGKGAGFMRNVAIVANADMVVAFWNGVSRGTESTIELAREAGKPLLVIGPGGKVLEDTREQQQQEAPRDDA